LNIIDDMYKYIVMLCDIY